MGMFGPKPGSWSLTSKSDPRWNCGGHVSALVVMAGLHPDAERALERLRERLGKPPEDLEYGCMKD